MKRQLTLLAAVIIGFLAYFGAITPASAQVAMQLESNFQNYLVGEPIWVRITLHNQSGAPLPFADTGPFKSDIFFEVEDVSGHLLPVKMDALDDGTVGFVLQPGRSHQIVLPLTRCCDLRKAGSFRVKAFLSHPKSLGTTRYISNQIRFNIETGTREWPDRAPTRVGTVSGGAGTEDEKISHRDVQLLSLYDGKDKAYYLNIEDNKYIYAQIRIGYEIDSTRRPKVALDAVNNIHVLMYISPKLLIYFKFDIDGVRLERKVLSVDAYGAPPTLTRKNGDVECIGGRPAKKSEYVEEPNNRFRATPLNYNP